MKNWKSLTICVDFQAVQLGVIIVQTKDVLNVMSAISSTTDYAVVPT